MRAVWILLESYLPFRIIGWRECDRLERNGFELGRDYERGQRRTAVEALTARLAQCEEKVAGLKV